MEHSMIAAILVCLTAVPATAQTEVKAMPAATFLDRLGINLHMSYTDGEYANVSNVKDDLAYLGITHVRDGVPDSNGGIPFYNQVGAIDALANAGIRFNIVILSWETNLQQDMLQIDEIARAHPGAISAIEGPNEINNWPVTYKGQTGEAAAEAFQRDIYSAVHAYEALKGVPVYYLTGGAPIDLVRNPGSGRLCERAPLSAQRRAARDLALGRVRGGFHDARPLFESDHRNRILHPSAEPRVGRRG